MPEFESDQPLLASVLDRLIDDNPGVRRQAPRSRNASLKDLKESVRRDLQNLLNTRVRCVPWPRELKELEYSLLNYGVPDPTGVAVGSSKERDKLCRDIESVVKRYGGAIEFRSGAAAIGGRRLRKVKVTLLDPAESIDRTIRFQIEAVLQVEPAPETIQFDSTLRLATGTFEVKGDVDG
jgi:type VI secretion system protein ImpF